jgi:hypothetical protein
VLERPEWSADFSEESFLISTALACEHLVGFYMSTLSTESSKELFHGAWAVGHDTRHAAWRSGAGLHICTPLVDISHQSWQMEYIRERNEVDMRTLFGLFYDQALDLNLFYPEQSIIDHPHWVQGGITQV